MKTCDVSGAKLPEKDDDPNGPKCDDCELWEAHFVELKFAAEKLVDALEDAYDCVPRPSRIEGEISKALKEWRDKYE